MYSIEISTKMTNNKGKEIKSTRVAEKAQEGVQVEKRDNY